MSRSYDALVVDVGLRAALRGACSSTTCAATSSAAVAVGVTGVHHLSPETTLEELEVLLEIPLRA